MKAITYEVVRHDGGWAYRSDSVFSETFKSHDDARGAAERAEQEQIVTGANPPVLLAGSRPPLGPRDLSDGGPC